MPSSVFLALGQRRRASSALFAALLVSGALLDVAHAEPPRNPPVWAPPRIESTPEVPYPKGAEGDEEVILVLTVQKNGTVGAVEVSQGKEPFASAAKQAAAGFRFQPATRNGEPASARIRFAVTFRQTRVEEPTPEEPSPASPAVNAPTAAAKPAEPKAITVDVRGEKPAPAVSTLPRAEVRQIPGTFGDPFRAIEVLPGVTPIVSGLPYFYVRGAPPGNVGYYLDGIRVPYLFHVGVGPSVVNPAMVDKVNLHAGGYPAQYQRPAWAAFCRIRCPNPCAASAAGRSRARSTAGTS